VWRIASRAIRGAVGCSHRVRRDAVRTMTPFRVPLSARSSRLSITGTLFTPQPSRHTQPTPPHAHPTGLPGQLHHCLVSSTGPAAPGPPLPARFFRHTSQPTPPGPPLSARTFRHAPPGPQLSAHSRASPSVPPGSSLSAPPSQPASLYTLLPTSPSLPALPRRARPRPYRQTLSDSDPPLSPRPHTRPVLPTRSSRPTLHNAFLPARPSRPVPPGTPLSERPSRPASLGTPFPAHHSPGTPLLAQPSRPSLGPLGPPLSPQYSQPALPRTGPHVLEC
jgi:hypothetical protein